MVAHMSVGKQSGLTYLWVMMLICIVGINLGAGAKVWSTQQRRQQELQLLFIGEELVRAVGEYYNAVTPHRYPENIEDLLRDKRFSMTKRYLRRFYSDPLTGKPEWGVIRGADGGIAGFYSLAMGVPIKKRGFKIKNGDFSWKESYQEWVFLFLEDSEAYNLSKKEL